MVEPLDAAAKPAANWSSSRGSVWIVGITVPPGDELKSAPIISEMQIAWGA